MENELERKPNLNYTELWAVSFGNVRRRQKGEKALYLSPLDLTDVVDQISASLEVLPLLNGVADEYWTPDARFGADIVTRMLCQNAQKIMSVMTDRIRAISRKSEAELKKSSRENESIESVLKRLQGIEVQVKAELDKQKETTATESTEKPERIPVGAVE